MSSTGWLLLSGYLLVTVAVVGLVVFLLRRGRRGKRDGK